MIIEMLAAIVAVSLSGQSPRAQIRAQLDDPKTFESAVEKGLKSEDEWIRRYTLNAVWMKDRERAVEIGKGMANDKSKLVKAYLLSIGSISRTDNFKFYRDNVAVSQDPSEDHDFAVIKKIELPITGWKFCFDEDNIGHRAEKPYFATDFDDSKWKDIAVNAQWELQGFPEYDGFAWYRVEFTLPEKPEGAQLVEFCVGAVDEDAWVWINGEYLGQHVEGLAGWDKPFRFNAAKELKWGAKNQVTIRVFDSCNAGGIWRPAVVEVLK